MFKNCDYQSPNWCKIWWKSFKKQDFPKVWMKCLEIARLQDFALNTQGLLGALSGPQTPCRIERSPLWKFLPTGLLKAVDFIVQKERLYIIALTQKRSYKVIWLLLYTSAVLIISRFSIIYAFCKKKLCILAWFFERCLHCVNLPFLLIKKKKNKILIASYI